MTDGEPSGEERPPRPVGALLKAAREAAGLSQPAACRHHLNTALEVEVTQTQLSRIERGAAMPTSSQAEALVAIYELDDDTAAEIIGAVEAHYEKREDRRYVVQRGSNILWQQAQFRRAERGVTRIRSFSSGIVLGQFQIADYIATFMGADNERRIRERLRRRADLPHEPPIRYEAVLTEGALTLTLGSFDVMARQLDDLAELTRHPQVDLRIIDRTVVVDAPPLVPAFNIYDERMVILSQIDGASTQIGAEPVERYGDEFARLQGLALRGSSARDALTRIADGYRALARGR